MKTDVADLAAMLRVNADALARYLLPRGSYQTGGREWKCSARNSPTGEAVSVVLRGSKQGMVAFWNGTRCGGDPLDLIANIHGYSNREAIKWARDWLGSGRIENVDRGGRERRLRLDEDQDRDKRCAKAAKIWNDAELLSGFSCAYLKSRGLDPNLGDGELRAHRGLWHPDGGTFPAIVARVSKNDNQVGIWRIYVKADGSGKAPVDNPKLGLGDVRGGAVRIGGIWPEIGIAEGIETALACRQIIRDATGHLIPIWAALSTSGIRSLELPDGITSVRIFADADPIKFRNGEVKESPGMSAAWALRARVCEKINVTVEAPPIGMDWLDVLNATKGK